MGQPPLDLASLLDPATELRQMNVATDDATLLALLKPATPVDEPAANLSKAVADLAAADFATRQAATETLYKAGTAALPLLKQALQSEDPEVRLTAGELLKEIERRNTPTPRGDTDYVKRLHAIRLLAQRKSTNARPTLEALLKDEDRTIRYAAEEALAAITGAASPRPTGISQMERLKAAIPANTGFAAFLDFERNAQAQTLDAVLNKALPQAPADNANTPPYLDRARMTPMIQGLLRAALLKVGNVRIDAVCAVTSSDLGDDQGAFALIVKGLYSLDHATYLFGRGLRETFDYAGHKVYFDSHGPAICLVDAETFVLTTGPGRTGDHIKPVLDALADKTERSLPERIQPAWDMVVKDGARLAVAGSFSDQQKADIQAAMKEFLQHREQRGNHPALAAFVQTLLLASETTALTDG